MKKLATIFLALIYIATTSGIVINTHYCMGEVAEIALGSSDDASCNVCGMENEGCCHDDQQVIKLTDNQQLTSFHTELPEFVPLNMEYDYNDQALLIPQSVHGKPRNHSPPLTVSRNILFCVYRI